MSLEHRIASAFWRDGETGSRYANPWSVWVRNALPLLLIAAGWSRVVLGWWALVAIAFALAWMWLEPRLLAVPQHTDGWASKAVFGERVWMNRKVVPVPRRHRIAPNLLAAATETGVLLALYGVVWLDGWATVFGTTLAVLGRLWFLDRMVWIYEDMKYTTPEYHGWLR